VRARHWLETFERALKQWRARQPLRKRLYATLESSTSDTPLNEGVSAAIRALLAQIEEHRPPHSSADADGSYAWAVRELKAEVRRCWPRTRRTDPVATALIGTIRDAILRQTAT
jgi:hypothetical protein